MRPKRPLLAPALVLLAILVPEPHPATANPAEVHAVPLPPGSRAVPDQNNLFISGRSFRHTVDFYERFLKRRGLLHDQVPVYRHRNTTLTRFLSRDRAAKWTAIHVFHTSGKTYVALVPAHLTPPISHGKESLPSAENH